MLLPQINPLFVLPVVAVFCFLTTIIQTVCPIYFRIVGSFHIPNKFTSYFNFVYLNSISYTLISIRNSQPGTGC